MKSESVNEAVIRDSELAGPDRLRKLVEERLGDARLVVVANREPYAHERDDDGSIRVDRPASGLVTGVEPLLRACGGVWIGHGSGSADRETADERGRVRVPPEEPDYTLRRIWLTDEEVAGYYYGFANEGLWPLCHIVHERPTFRKADWKLYREVNERFARAAVEETGEKGLLLTQDYHYALLPRMVRDMAPETVISIFWHIPWPNEEVVDICPWKRELLSGMLGADIIGFHTRYYCLNFLDTVQRHLECRIELETMSVWHQGHKTRIRPYPISIEWPPQYATRDEGRVLRASYGLDDDVRIIVGVDRADYTKGLIERVQAIGQLMEDFPDLVGKVVLVQVAAPSRTNIPRYADFIRDVQTEVNRVNEQYGNERYQPVILRLESVSPEEIRQHYAMADVALVTPLHDGMNLVAKEYVASLYDNRGVLILSQFAGAAKELEGALIVNPYDAEGVARAIRRAITMGEEEQKVRVGHMREAIEKNTIYDWSASLLNDMAHIWERRHSEWRDETEKAGA